jgi:putative FmdB family regulatory protein
MPIYEYRCLTCRRRFSVFYRSLASVVEPPVCPRCDDTRVERLLSRVTVLRGRSSGERTADADETWAEESGAGDEDWGEGDDDGFPETDDPRELARWTRRMSDELGEPLDPALDRALSELERGADPDEVLERLEEEPLDTGSERS